MAWNDNAMQVAAQAICDAATHLQSHSGDPGSNGTNNLTTADREAVTWTTPTNDGDFDLSSAVVFTGIAASGAVQYVSAWSALSGGTHYGNFALSGDTTANGSGEYTLDSLTTDGSST